MKKSFLLRLYSLALIFGLISFNTAGQITVVSGYTAQDLAATLVGTGVVMMNATYAGQCPTEGGGSGAGKFTFNGNPSDIGIDSGIVLTSGNALNIPNPVSFFSSASFVGGAAGDADLNTLLSGTSVISHDACVLEFDFVPAGDTIKFDYVFGSEEYPEFDCSTVNDVFGFFISGPGLPATLNNLAVVPGTTIPISINTINNSPSPGPECTNFGSGSPFSAYYVDNQALNGQNVCYDGFTTVLTAVSNVIPCDTYHLKLAIGDGGDQIYDSGVFLKAGSLNSVGIDLDAESTEGGNDPLDPHCIRGCKPGKFVFKRAQPLPQPLTIKYLIGGTATIGVDYESIADSVVIPAYQDSVVLDIHGIVRPPVGPKTVTIRALSPYHCGNGQANVIDSSTITIYDSLYVKIISPPVTVCPNTEVTIEAEADPTLHYEWSPAALIPDPLPLGLTIHPKPTVPTTYTITATQPGAPATCPPSRASYLANVEAIPQIIVPSKDTTICIHDSVNLNVYALPENIGYLFNWSPADHLRDDFSTNNKFFAPPGDYTYILTATSPVAHCSSSTDMTIHVIPPFTFNSVTPTDTTINYGDRIQLNSESEAIYWIWDPGTFLSDPTIKDPIASPTRSMDYTLIGINEYGCRDSALVHINVEYESVSDMPNAFSPNGDGLNDVFKIQNYKYEKLLSFKIFNRYGQLVYDGADGEEGWDGTINGKPAPADVYYYLVRMVLPGAIEKNLKGDVTLIR